MDKNTADVNPKDLDLLSHKPMFRWHSQLFLDSPIVDRQQFSMPPTLTLLQIPHLNKVHIHSWFYQQVPYLLQLAAPAQDYLLSNRFHLLHPDWDEYHALEVVFQRLCLEISLK